MRSGLEVVEIELSLKKFYSPFLNSHCTYSGVICLLHGGCHVKLLLCRRTLSVHHKNMHRKRRVHACLAVTCHLRATAVTRG